MKPSKKAFLILMLAVSFLQLGRVSVVYSAASVSQTLEITALACLTDVYPIDLNHYDVTLGPRYTLPPVSSDTSTTQAVDYTLNSPDSNLVANFLFKNSMLYSFNLRVLNGSVVTARSYANLTDATRDFLEKYQSFSGRNSTGLIHLLDNFDENKDMEVALGNISLSVSHLVIPNVANATTFHWINEMDGKDETSVTLNFDKGIFDSFYDGRGNGEVSIQSATSDISTTVSMNLFAILQVIVIIVATVAVVAVAAVVYVKKRKPKTG